MIKKSMLAAALLAGAAGANAATVVNGSFEVPEVAGVSYYDCGAVACTGGGAGFERNGGPFGYDPAPDGNQVLHLQNGGVATLSLTNLVLGQLYSVNFFASARPGFAALPVELQYNGATLGSFTPTSTSFRQFSGFSFSATGTTGSLSFVGGNGDGDLNAAIDAVGLSAVPEPATWAMMLFGFGAVGYSFRRRNSGFRFAQAV